MFWNYGLKPEKHNAAVPPAASPQALPAAAPKAGNADPAAGTDTRVPPDPVTAILPAISALGAIASIAAINWTSQDKTPDRAKSKRKASTALKELETCCLGLAEIFRRFQRHPRVFGLDGATTAPAKFGIAGVRVNADGARGFQQIVNDVASMLVLASQSAFDVMSAVEDGEIDAPEAVYFGFGEQQERLNALLAQRAPLKTIVETGLDVGIKLAALVRQLKAHRVE